MGLAQNKLQRPLFIAMTEHVTCSNQEEVILFKISNFFWSPVSDDTGKPADASEREEGSLPT